MVANRSDPSPARRYAQIVGVVLLIIFVLGIVLGDQSWLGILNTDLVEDIVHLITGALLVYVGFALRDSGMVRTIVGVLGIVYLVVGVLSFITPTIFGLIPHGYSIVDDLLHLGLGVIGIAVAWLVGRS